MDSTRTTKERFPSHAEAEAHAAALRANGWQGVTVTKDGEQAVVEAYDTTAQQFPGTDALQVEGALEWAYRQGYAQAEQAASAYGRLTGRKPSKRDLGLYGDTLQFSGNLTRTELLEALQAIASTAAATEDAYEQALAFAVKTARTALSKATQP